MQRIALMLACAVMTPLAPAAALGQTPNRAQAAGTNAESLAAEGIRHWEAGRYEAAVVAWQSPAQDGDAESQFRLAQAYRDGQGTQIDTEKAIALLRKAALQGHFEAADEYGILLFQSGRIKDALAWIQDSAERGEPRAQYYLGIALFNGDDLDKNWVSAYALMTRAAASGLAPAVAALNRMDETIPLEDRRKGVLLGEELETAARQNRARQLATADLRAAPQPPADRTKSAAPPAEPGLAAAVDRFFDNSDRTDPPRKAPNAASAKPPASAQPTPVRPAPAQPAPAAASTARPAQPSQAPAPVGANLTPPAPVKAPSRATAIAKRPAAPAKAVTGPWRVQLGAFGEKANADRLWSRLRNHRALAARKRFDVAAGPILRLQAGPFASEGEARQACSALAGVHGQCMVLRQN